MRLVRSLGTSGIEIAVWFLTTCYDSNDTIYILVKRTSMIESLRIGLQQVAGTLDGFIRVCIVESEGPSGIWIFLCRICHALGGIGEIGITTSLLTLIESQRNCNIARGFQTR